MTNNKQHSFFYNVFPIKNSNTINHPSSINHTYSIPSQSIAQPKMMYHKPHVRRASRQQQPQQQKPTKSQSKIPSQSSNKPLPRVATLKKTDHSVNQTTNQPQNQKHKPSYLKKSSPVDEKIQKLQKVVKSLQNTTNNANLQEQLINEIKGIKSELRDIKAQMGMKSTNNNNEQYDHQYENVHDHQGPPSFNNNYQEPPQGQESQEDQGENIMNFAASRATNARGQQKHPLQQQKHIPQQTNNQGPQQFQRSPVTINQMMKNKTLIDIGKIQPYMKEFKLHNTENKTPKPFYYGYHKKSSKPVIIKYCSQDQTMDFVMGIYEKLWKNIVKAKNVCINKIYDLNEPLATNILVLEQNQTDLNGILSETKPMQLAQHLIRAIQFLHQCGYLYRNIHPDHIMKNPQGNIVLIDFKRMKKFVNIKSKVIEVRGDLANEEIHQFISNARITHSLEGRKDDLECIGYLMLYVLEGRLPWNHSNILQVREKLVLNQIFGKYPSLLKYMIKVQKMTVHEAPNYNELCEVIAGENV